MALKIDPAWVPGIGKKINLNAMSRRISNASWIADMAALQKVIQLCRRCVWQMPWHWERKFHYAKWEVFQGAKAVCDKCRNEDAVSLYRPTDTAWFAQCERDRAGYERTKAREQAFAVHDKRRVS